MSSVAKKTGKNSIEDKMYRQSRIFYQILKYVFLTMCCLMVIIPLIVVLIGAFKTHDEYISTGVFTLPEVPQFENFKIAFVNGKVMQGLLNTLIILAVSCFGTIITGTMTAFVLQRFNMLFTRAVKMVFLIAALLPNISMQVTVFQIVSKLGLYNTLAAPCILYIGTDIISIYIFIQFLNNISKSLDESAILDGASYPRVYFSIILPMLRPAIATVLVIKFVSIYNDFYTANLYMPSQDLAVVSTALSIIYPIQLLMIALAVGTGVGINTVMAAKLGAGNRGEAEEHAGVGTPLAVAAWVIFAAVCWAIMPAYARLQTDTPEVIADVVTYGRIVCVFSFGLFLESIWTKVHQAEGNMRRPMAAQIAGAVTNIILDPLLIFGMFGLPEMGIAGAACATVAGQIVAALVVMKNGFRKPPELRKFPRCIAAIYRLGTPNILMQAAYTVYIFGLNLILATFSDQAVTVLGLYYKWQSFFFIPLGSMQTCIVPVVSYNYAARNIGRCKKTLVTAIVFGMALMFLGTLCFEIIPGPMLRVFSSDEKVIEIGVTAFRIIGISFIPLVSSLTFPVFFQAVGWSLKSSLLTVFRTVVLFVPLAFIFSRIGGLDWFWLTFPVTDSLSTLLGFIWYKKFMRRPYASGKNPDDAQKPEEIIKPSKPGVIITIAREHGSSGKQVGKLVAEKLGIPFYYKEMTALAAQESGLDKEFISDINRNSPDMLHDMYLSTKAVQHAVTAQNSMIRRIAENGSCVIVGRAADYILRGHPDVVRVFIYAPEEYRIAKVMEVYGDTRAEAEKNIRRSDDARAAYYKSISGSDWGDRRHYDLMVDSSIGAEASAKIVEEYITGFEKSRKKHMTT